jgi:hypothetical protein
LITKDTLYHEGENFLAVYEGDYYFQEPTHKLTIEISGDLVNFYVDDQKVASTFLPTDSNHLGRIGMYQHWEEPGGTTYANPKIKIPDEGG